MTKIKKILSKLFSRKKDWPDLTPRERVIALEFERANRGAKR